MTTPALTGVVLDHSALVSAALGGLGVSMIVMAATTTMTTLLVPSAALTQALLHDDVLQDLDAQRTLYELLRSEHCVVDDLTRGTSSKISAKLFGDDLHAVRGTATTLAVGHCAVAASQRGYDVVTLRADLWGWYTETGLYIF